jgi:cellulose synthase/poly-beta-1,6-N-acetylglucosamine synthase-like glycosyltransferase
MAGRDLDDPPGRQWPARGAEASIYAERARWLGLPFAGEFNVGRATVEAVSVAAVRNGTFAMSQIGERVAFVAPEENALPALARWLEAYPEIGVRLRIATPTAIRAALMQSGAASYLREAINRLSRLYPDLSARRLATRDQVAFLFLALGLLAAAIVFWPNPTLITVNLIGSCFFFGVTVLRFIAAGLVSRHKVEDFIADRSDDDLPVYSVLVPLYREAALVGELIAALDQIDWPADRLDIKLIVEADDTETVAAVAMAVDGAPYEIIAVPPAEPRTKPKALAFALPFARGSLVTIYDAEDRPHPQQLRQAHSVFNAADARLACLQASIVIDNQRDSFLARMFAIEYSTLFDGLFPALVDLGLPLPLGGTSNHFRREALDAVGGWDPFNVTEDADLGIRLARFGYRSATISLPTYEEAPARLMPWLRQRTRWFKGWLQTWLVHMRKPVKFARQVGLRQFIGFNLVGTGMIVSVIIHPIYLATLLIVATDPLHLWRDGSLVTAAIVGLNLFNLAAGYLAMTSLAGRTLSLRGRADEMPALIGLPIYWLLMSLAAYRAIWQLVTRPHLWEKTPHPLRGQGRRAIGRRQVPLLAAAPERS